MKVVTISRGGQVSIPAEVRKRWQTRKVLVEDKGDELIYRPMQEDPVEAMAGIFADRARELGLSSDEVVRELRDQDNEAMDRKWRER